MKIQESNHNLTNTKTFQNYLLLLIQKTSFNVFGISSAMDEEQVSPEEN
jgi:hypothetical protein